MKRVLWAKNIHRIYENAKTPLHVLKGIDLEVFTEDFLAIVGPSGAGKSTLLHILGGLDKPTRGEVYLDEENIYELDEERLAYLRNRKIGFVFQFYHLLPEFNIWENIILPTFISNSYHREAKKGLEHLLKIVGLGERKFYYPDQLSGGEKQRVAIVRALVNQPEMLFCDEPTGNLDSENTKIIISLLKKINQENKTAIILVTHNLEVAKNADKIYYLKEGKLVEK